MDFEVEKLAFQLGEVKSETSDLKGGIRNLTNKLQNELENLGNEIESTTNTSAITKKLSSMLDLLVTFQNVTLNALQEVNTQVMDTVDYVTRVNTTLGELIASTQRLTNKADQGSQERAEMKAAMQRGFLAVISEVQSACSYAREQYIHSSCREAAELSHSDLSGYYWVATSPNSAVKVYCDMERHRHWARYGSTEGWMRVAYLNMNDSSHQCPSGFSLRTGDSKRLCQKLTDVGCTSITFPANDVHYGRVCGQVRAYQKGTPDAFRPYESPYFVHSTTIDGQYVDGLSITHGTNPRKHIWTFAAALDSLTSDGSTRECPCTNTGTAYNAYSLIPPYIGTDYFCETASHQHYQHSRFYHEDPLWDGEGCGPTSSCCQFNSPPWFCKELPQPTTDDIEVRVCTDQNYSDEAIPFELIELYVQ